MGTAGVAWYEVLRERYRPAVARIVLVGESPPDPGDGQRRFFYSDTLTKDWLFRAVAIAFYGEGVDPKQKTEVLSRLCADGVFLVDACLVPVNKLPRRERRARICASVADLSQRLLALKPSEGVVICHAGVFRHAAPALRQAGVRLLHEEALPFPWGNHRARFVAGLRKAAGVTLATSA